MNTAKTLAALVVTTYLASATFAPAYAQQADHHPDAAKAGAGQSAPDGKPGMMGMMSKGGMMGMMQKK